MARRPGRSIPEWCEDHREVPPAELWTNRDRRDHRRSEGLHKTLDGARELAARRRRRSDRVHLPGEQCRREVTEIGAGSVHYRDTECTAQFSLGFSRRSITIVSTGPRVDSSLNPKYPIIWGHEETPGASWPTSMALGSMS